MSVFVYQSLSKDIVFVFAGPLLFTSIPFPQIFLSSSLPSLFHPPYLPTVRRPEEGDATPHKQLSSLQLVQDLLVQ